MHTDYFHSRKKELETGLTSRISHRLATRHKDTARALVHRKTQTLYIRKGSTGILAYRNELLARIVDSATVYKLHRELDGSFNFKSEILAQWVGTSHLLYQNA